MIHSHAVAFDIVAQLVITVQIAARFDLFPDISLEGGLIGNVAHNFNPLHQTLHIAVVLTEIMLDQWLLIRIRTVQSHMSARIGAQASGVHRPSMRKEAPRNLCGGHGGAEKQLQVGAFDIRGRFDKGSRLCGIGGKSPTPRKNPF